MRILICCLIFLFLKNISSGQSLEGEVEYSVKYRSKMEKFVSNKDLELKLGTNRIVFYDLKNKNYLTLYNGNSITKQLFLSDSNKIYNFIPNTDTVYWINSKLVLDTIQNIHIRENEDTIKGVLCDVLIIKTKLETSYYYLNAKKFSFNEQELKHLDINILYNILSSIKIIPKKIVIENVGYITELVEKEKKDKKINPERYKIPKNLVLIKGIQVPF